MREDALINGRRVEKVRFNIAQCANGHCLSECPHDSSDHCVKDLLCDALAMIDHLEKKVAERDALLAAMGVSVPEGRKGDE